MEKFGENNLYVSLIFLVFGIALTLFLLFRKPNKDSKIEKIARVLTPSKVFLAVVFISIFLLYVISAKDSKGVSLRIASAVISTIQHFTFDGGTENLREAIFGDNIATTPCNLYLFVVSLLAPVCTIITTVSLIFKDFHIQFKYRIFSKRKAYILSELNENSICLAEDIRYKDPSALIIFAGVNKKEADDDKSDLLDKVKDINALTFKKSVDSFKFVPRKSETNIYFINIEENDNVKNGIDLFKKCKDKELHIHIFSTLKSTEKFIDNIDKDKAKADINLINIAQIIAYKIMSEKPMFKAAENCGSDTMSVLVVGAGAIGMECAKAAMWCGVMKNFKFKINIINMTDSEKKFDSEVKDFKDNLKHTGTKVNYKFHICDVGDPELYKILDENCLDANYIIVGVGNDELTVNTADKIRKYFIRKATEKGNYKVNSPKEPLIIPIVRSSDYRDLLKDDDKSLSDNVQPVGFNSEIFKEDMIDNWVIEKLAEQIHEQYKKVNVEDKRSYKEILQTDKRSNRASAIHLFYKLGDVGVDWVLPSKTPKLNGNEMSADELENFMSDIYNIDEGTNTRRDVLRETDHNRWCVFQLLDGWVPISIDQLETVYERSPGSEKLKENKLRQAKMHGSLVPNEELENVGEKLYDNKDKFNLNYNTIMKFVGKEMVEFLTEGDNIK